MRDRRPVVLLAFANSPDRYLRHLALEARGVRERLEVAENAGLCELVMRANATADEVLDVFQDARYRDRIAVFHFAGHASDYTLLLESVEQRGKAVHAGGFAAFISRQRGLELVFLNGCSTEPQVERLLNAGIPAVIATTESIADDVAAQLSIRFYAGLAAGASIRTAYDEAVAAVRTTRGEHPRDVFRTASARPDAWPWSFHVREGSERVCEWNLPAAAGDPLYGLPRPPLRDLPESPYRGLQWFREDDAEIFFGRGREIRTFHELVTSPSASPIVLFYGESGVGKSSLLAAGLLPRLAATHEVRYTRRERETGLAGTLVAALDAGTTTPADAWAGSESIAGKPLIVIIDQVDEAFTRPGEPAELESFVEVLADVFADRATRPRGRIVISFRKEWLAEIEDRLRARSLPRSKFFLDRLDRAGIIEIVEGPVRVERLRSHFRLDVESGLAAVIADDVLEDPDAAIAPTLQVLLAKLWTVAVASNEVAPSFDQEQYQTLRRQGVLLDDFVEQQLTALRASNPEITDSGLALDLLASHTTAVGTADHRSRADVERSYGTTHPAVPELLQRMIDLQLLAPYTSRPDSETRVEGTRLAHDTLAPLVRRRFDDSDRPGQRARRILESRAIEWADSRNGLPLDQSDLETVEAGRTGMRAWTAQEARLIEASRARRARMRFARRSLMTAAIVALGLILRQTWVAQAREAESQSRALAVAATSEQQSDIALLLAVEAVRTDPTFEASNALLGALLRPPMRLLRSLTPGFRVFDVAFHPNDSILAGAVDDGTVRLWDVTNRVPVGEPMTGHDNGVTAVAFSPDGSVLASGGFDGTIRLWDVGSRQPVGTPLMGHPGYVLRVVFSPEGRVLASGNADGVVQLWEMSTGHRLGEPLLGHAGDVEALAFSSDGLILASADAEGLIQLWDVPTGMPIGGHAQAHQFAVLFLEFSRNDSLLISFGSDGYGRLWEVPALTPTGQPVSWESGFVTSVTAHTRGALVAFGTSEGEVGFLDGLFRQVIGTRRPHAASVTRLAFTADTSLMVSGSLDGTLGLWDLAQALPGRDLAGLPFGASTLDVSTDGAWLAAGSRAGTVRLWNSATDEPIDLRSPIDFATMAVDSSEPYALTEEVLAIAFSPDASLLVAGSNDGTVRLWDATSFPAASAPVEWTDTGGISSLAFHPGGRLLATGGIDGTVRLHDLRAGDAAGELPLGETASSSIRSIVFEPSGTLLVVTDGAVRRWNVETRQPSAATPVDGDFINVVAIDPGGRLLASGGQFGALRLRDADSLRPVGDPFIGHASDVISLAFGPDRTRLASGDLSGTIRLWDVASRRPIGGPISIRGRGPINGIRFSPDGSRLIAATENGAVLVLDMRVEEWIGRACLVAGRNLPFELWTRLLPDRPYSCTCSALPPGEGVGPGAGNLGCSRTDVRVDSPERDSERPGDTAARPPGPD
ncbi:MAG TPA: CHAT domain-containing protein, partial [Longimicrobiales bacterium]|nr:CHAT domain-containing protein [Longimicrobiales bacterium]